MKSLRSFIILLSVLSVLSCGRGDQPAPKPRLLKGPEVSSSILPIDKGFSQYISGYTSGIIPANSVIEIRFTPEFAAKAGKQIPAGLFEFNPPIKGKTEWADEMTLVFRPAKLLDPGKIYTGELSIHKLGSVEERLKVFPLRIQTLKKDFSITTGTLEPAPTRRRDRSHTRPPDSCGDHAAGSLLGLPLPRVGLVAPVVASIRQGRERAPLGRRRPRGPGPNRGRRAEVRPRASLRRPARGSRGDSPQRGIMSTWTVNAASSARPHANASRISFRVLIGRRG